MTSNKHWESCWKRKIPGPSNELSFLEVLFTWIMQKFSVMMKNITIAEYFRHFQCKSQKVIQNITTTSMKKTIPSDHLHRWSLLHCNLHWVDHHKHISSVYQNINCKGAVKKIQKQKEKSSVPGWHCSFTVTATSRYCRPINFFKFLVGTFFLTVCRLRWLHTQGIWYLGSIMKRPNYKNWT